MTGFGDVAQLRGMDANMVPSALVCEFSPKPARAVGAVLEACGFSVTYVRDGIEAWAELSKGGVQLLVASSHLPGLPGEALVLRALSRFRGLGVMFLDPDANCLCSRDAPLAWTLRAPPSPAHLTRAAHALRKQLVEEGAAASL